MLIDNSDSSAAIRNVSYLIPIGICLFSCISSIDNLLTYSLLELGVCYKIDPYLTYWMVHIAVTILIALFGFLVLRSMWRKIVTGEFNCERLFVSLLILSIVFFGLWNIGYYFLNLLREARYENNQVDSSEYIEFLSRISPYVWGVQFVITVLLFTFATKVRLPHNQFERLG